MFKIKAVGDMVLDVLAIPFGSPSDKDLDGDYFSKDTDLHLDKFTDPLILYWHGRDVGGNEQQKAEVIGQSLGHTIKPDGVWLKVQLDKANKYAQRVWDAAKRGLAAASSGTVAHLMRKAADGFIADWPLIELSLFDVDHSKRRLPVNKNAIALPAAKALYIAAGRSFPETETEYISDAETNALQARAREVIAEIDDYFLRDAVDRTLEKIAFDREPTEAEQLYEDAAIGAVNYFANTEIKSLPVRIMDYMPASNKKGTELAGRYNRDDQGHPRIILSSHYGRESEYKTFMHEVGHAIDHYTRGDDYFFSTTYATKGGREEQANEYRQLLKFTAWQAACSRFYGGSAQVKSISVNNLLLALKSIRA